MEIRSFTEPFRHWLVDGAVPEALLPPDAEGLVRLPWPWVVYDNELERRKRACNDLAAMGPVAALFGHLTAADVVGRFGALAGIPGLRPDPTLHGGGVHVTDPGGWLACHVDYSLHPDLSPPMERRLNLVLFLNPFWQGGWGGALELYADDGATCVKRVY